MHDTLERWWRRPDHFDWLSAYIADHRLQLATRFLIGAPTVVLGAMAAALTLSPTGPHGVAAKAVSVLAATVGVTMGILWLTGWPSRRVSVAFALTADGCFAAVCLAQSDPVVGLMGCSVFATIGGYIAFFHPPRFMTCHLGLSAAVTAALAARVAAERDILLGLCLATLVGTVIMSVSVVIHLLMHFLRIDVLESERDPLTNLFNRRGFDRAARTLLEVPGKGDAHLVVAMVDLDRFKALNDDRGHAAGDRVLTAIADVLRAHTSTAAVIGRVGGEEFLVAEITSTPDPTVMADQLCRAIAATPYPITASIGTSATALSIRHDTVRHPALATLIDVADTAMYEAKRRGGNRSHHSGGQNCSLSGFEQVFSPPGPFDSAAVGDGDRPPVSSAGAAG